MDYESKTKEYLLGVREGVQKTIQLLQGSGAIKGNSVPLGLLNFVEELDKQIVLKDAEQYFDGLDV